MLNFPMTVRKLMKPSRMNKGSLGLRDSAAASIGEITVQEIPGAQRPHNRDENPAPGRGGGRVHASAQIFREQNEGDHYRADHRADNQREHQNDGVLVVAEAETLPAREVHGQITAGTSPPEVDRGKQKSLVSRRGAEIAE